MSNVDRESKKPDSGESKHGYQEYKTQGNRKSQRPGTGMMGNMKVSSYKDLDVWNKGIEIVDHVY